MPTYDYVCDACGHAFEHFQSMSDRLLRTCPKCGKKKLVRKVGAGAGLIFKGTGFYITDYKKSSSSGAPEEKSSKSDASSESSASSAGRGEGPSKGDAKSGGKGDGKGAAGAGSSTESSSSGKSSGSSSSGSSSSGSPGGKPESKPESSGSKAPKRKTSS